jgi:hypothetical protein
LFSLTGGALATAYGRADSEGAGYSTGPTLGSATFTAHAGPDRTAFVVLNFTNTGASKAIVLYASNKTEFDLSQDGGKTWSSDVEARLSASCKSCIKLTSPSSPQPTHVRYLFSSAPCAHPHDKQGRCTVYSSAEDLPVTPFLAAVGA